MKSLKLYFNCEMVKNIYWKSYKTEKDCYNAIKDMSHIRSILYFDIKQGNNLVSRVSPNR